MDEKVSKEIPHLTPAQQLAWIKDRMEMCFDNMEGCNLEEFIRWESLYGAYATIYKDMLKESKSK